MEVRTPLSLLFLCLLTSGLWDWDKHPDIIHHFSHNHNSVMKTFNIYQYQVPGGHLESIKKGWSWPAFFFGWIWCFVKGLTMVGVIVLIVVIVLITISMQDEIGNVVGSLASFGLAIWLGVNGNRLREQKLLDEGYVQVGLIEASSPESAVANYQASTHNSAPMAS